MTRSNIQTISPSHASKLIAHGIKYNVPQLWVGPPGIGKTDIIRAAAIEAGAILIMMHPVVSDPTDFKGLPFAVQVEGRTDHAEFLPFSDLHKMINANQLMVVFIDDLIQAPPAVQAAAMQLILAREINGHKLSENVRFMAATNRKEDKAGGSMILEPVKSRFCILHMGTSQRDWAKWALTQGSVDPVGVAWTNFKPEFIQNIVHDPDIVNTPSPRTVTAMLRDWQTQDYPADVEHQYLAGHAGHGAAAEFLTFVRVYKNLPDVDKYLQSPEKFKTPTKPDILYALAGALAAKATKQNAPQFFKAVSTLGPDFSVVAVRDALIRDPSLHSVPCITDWALENQEVLI